VTPRVDVAGPENAGELWTVQRAAFLDEATVYATTDIPPLRETLDELHADLAAPHVRTLAVWLGTRLVGSARGRVDGDRMEVARISVAPDQRGQGFGRLLLTAVEQAAPEQVRTLWLYTGARSEDNQRMYRKAGYREKRRVRDSIGIEIVQMEKPVDAPPNTVA
jgi:ribosomal protein S18 acetylase RimI-like enzyme